MIKNFSDHAANERTFLAWVRTGIAIVAFGFLVERFDLFLAFSTPQAKVSVPRGQFGHVAGLALTTLLVVLASALLFYLYHTLSAQA